MTSPKAPGDDAAPPPEDDDDVPLIEASSEGDRPEGDREGRGGGRRGRPRGGRGQSGGFRGDRGPRGGGPRIEATDDLSHLGKLVGLVARALVDAPDQVVVREAAHEHHPRIELTVAQDDIGKIIGKDGRTAQSIRTLLLAAAARSGRRPHLDILD
jgi:predicted RNA-binding protein YlqC (UPF0109 family)